MNERSSASFDSEEEKMPSLRFLTTGFTALSRAAFSSAASFTMSGSFFVFAPFHRSNFVCRSFSRRDEKESVCSSARSFSQSLKSTARLPASSSAPEARSHSSSAASSASAISRWADAVRFFTHAEDARESSVLFE